MISWSWETALEEECCSVITSKINLDEFWEEHLSRVCPWCESEGSFRTHGAAWKCERCLIEGANLVSFYQQRNQLPFRRALEALYSRYVEPIIHTDTIKEMSDDLFANSAMMANLARLRIDQHTIKRLQLGVTYSEEAKRDLVSFPVYNRFGFLTTIVCGDFNRLYPVFGEVGNLWPLNVLKIADAVILVPSLYDCLVCLAHGVSAVTTGSPEIYIKPADLRFLRGKNVAVSYDVGKKSSNRAWNQIIQLLDGGTAEVRDVHLSSAKKQATSLGHFLLTQIRETAALELAHIIRLTVPRARPPKRLPGLHEMGEATEGRLIPFARLRDSGFFGIPLRVAAVISDVHETTHQVPKIVSVVCLSPTKNCVRNKCRFSTGEYGIRTRHITIDEPLWMQLLEKEWTTVFYKEYGLFCSSRLRVKALETESVHRITLEPHPDDKVNPGDSTSFTGYLAGPMPRLGDPCVLTGYLCHNAAASLTGAFSGVKYDADIIRDSDPDALSVFGQLNPIKMMEFYDHVGRSLTRIDDPLLNMALDLPFFSPVEFEFAGQRYKGGLDISCIGPIGCGKSRIVDALMNHYQIGARVSAHEIQQDLAVRQLTATGIKWGIIPQQHRGMLIVDHSDKIRPLTWDKLSRLREVGLCMTGRKGQMYETTALMSFIWLAVRHQFTIRELPRFDYVVTAKRSDIMTGDKPPHYFSGAQCADLLAWIKSRTWRQVKFTEQGTERILSAGTELEQDKPGYRTNMIPKLARVAAAIAGRVYSNEGDGILVDYACAVEAVEFIKGLYG